MCFWRTTVELSFSKKQKRVHNDVLLLHYLPLSKQLRKLVHFLVILRSWIYEYLQLIFSILLFYSRFRPFEANYLSKKMHSLVYYNVFQNRNDLKFYVFSRISIWQNINVSKIWLFREKIWHVQKFGSQQKLKLWFSYYYSSYTTNGVRVGNDRNHWKINASIDSRQQSKT